VDRSDVGLDAAAYLPHGSASNWRVRQSAVIANGLGSVMDTSVVDAGHLLAFIERIEKLEEEKRAIADDIKDVYAEAKGTGFDPKVMRKIVSLRRQDKSKRQEEEEILGLYLSALGME
jgi:uncharacterized protein (UPF0335 family)